MIKYPEPYILAAERSLDQLETQIPSTAEEFFANPILRDAILMRVFQIGENLSQLGSRFPDGYRHAPEIWDQIVGLRNIIAHGYEKVRVVEIWRCVSDDLEGLRSSLVDARSEGWFSLSERNGK